jgi:hypothetical protein
MFTMTFMTVAGLVQRSRRRCRLPILRLTKVVNIVNYLNFVKQNGVDILVPLNNQQWSGVGAVQSFIVQSPDGAWVEFFEFWVLGFKF